MTNKINPPLIIAGSGRSGTTWILDSIAEANGMATIFEPLHPIGVPAARPFANRYVRDDSHEPELRNFMNKVFEGRLKSIWAKYRIRPDRLRPRFGQSVFQGQKNCMLLHSKDLLAQYVRFLNHYRVYRKSKSDRFIVKFIRANLMLGWLAKNYDARIVFTVRHPAAVVASILRLIENSPHDWGYKKALEQYENDERLQNDYLCKYNDIRNNPLSLVQGLTVVWCIENILPMIIAQNAGCCVVFYEDLVANPENHWEHIVQSLGLNVVPSKNINVKPSQQASIDIREKLFDKTQLTKWKKYLSEKQLREIDNILHAFHVTVYSAWDPMPISRIQTVEDLH
ncbi:MAG: sulfotransferase [Bacteroidales bacterium]|nr:sulfotransferase [Bacteroidales bacterium]